MQWLILVQYGIVGTLFSYVVSLFVTSPLAAFAATAGYQIIMFVVSGEQSVTAFSLRLTFGFPVVHRSVSPRTHVR